VGMDLLDIIFRLEKAFGIKIRRGELEGHIPARTPPDFTVGDIVELIRAKRPAYPIVDGAIACDVCCVKCRYNLRGVNPFGNCPECGTPAGYEAQLRRGVERVLVDALGVDPIEIKDDASVFRDLGAS
jgi:acyl carrier protein